MTQEAQVDSHIRPTPANPIEVWHTEHQYFKRLLAILQREVAGFHAGQRPNYELMENILSYLREYSDRFHHPREDVAFACLEEHCPDLAPVLSELRLEHRVIANAGEKLRGELEAQLTRNDRCRIEEIEDRGDRRYLVHNFRRAASAVPKKILL